MKAFVAGYTLAIVMTFAAVGTATAQGTRRAAPGGEASAPAKAGVARDPRFPYAGFWKGLRFGDDEIGFEFTVVGDRYSGQTLVGGGVVAHERLVASAAGLRWEQPNNGGGSWLYTVRLAGPDSLVGTLKLQGGPPDLRPIPEGTLMLIRQRPANREKE